jgi:hypothetical protein
MFFTNVHRCITKQQLANLKRRQIHSSCHRLHGAASAARSKHSGHSRRAAMCRVSAQV